MGWARIDDSFHDHPKLIGLSLEALGLWTKCLTWAHRHGLTDPAGNPGFIPAELPRMFAGARSKRLAAELTTAKLWDSAEFSESFSEFPRSFSENAPSKSQKTVGWVIHDYVDYLPASERPATASDVSKARSEAGKRGALARWSKAEGSQTDSNLPSEPMASTDGKTMPPTRPDPTRTSNTPSSRGCRLPDDWQPTRDMIDKARVDFPSVDLRMETDAFRDYWRAKAGKDAVKVDWALTWQGWMRRTQRDSGGRLVAAGSQRVFGGTNGQRKSLA